MPEPGSRLPCPVCLAVMMDQVRFGTADAIEVDRCARCGGVWFDRGELDRLRTAPGDTRTALLMPEDGRPSTQCHHCHAPVDRGAGRCAGCGAENRIPCPRCARPMEVVPRSGLVLDVCRSCEGVWFDRAELTSVWGASLQQALTRRGTPSTPTQDAAFLASDVVLHTAIFAPDLLTGAGEVAGASASGIAELPGQAFEVVGEAAGKVFEAVVSIVEGIF